MASVQGLTHAIRPLAPCRQGLTHVDWSADGLHLQTDSSGRQHQYWDAGSVLEKRDAHEALARKTWATWTCVYGWSVQVPPNRGEDPLADVVGRIGMPMR